MVCSSGVNISELNLIAKAKYLDEKGRPLRDWLLTHSYLYGWLGSLLSSLVNLILRSPFIKWIIEAVLKIDRRRELPSYESPTFRQWFRKHQSQSSNPPSPPFAKVGDACLPVGRGGFEVGIHYPIISRKA
jgi:glycerol-3-phosphate dehydrogenase subunit C